MEKSRTKLTLKNQLTNQIDQYRIKPNPYLGQHFLIDQRAFDLISQTVNPHYSIIEIGPGTGLLTQSLVKTYQPVTAIEIDQQFHPILGKLQHNHPNLRLIYHDALKIDWRSLTNSSSENFQLIANLPFHIIEPFFHLMVHQPLNELVIILGQNTTQKIIATPHDGQYCHLSAMTQAFYSSEILLSINKNCFYPQPKTNAVIMRLTRKNYHQTKNCRHDTIMQHLFLNYHDRLPLNKSLHGFLSEFKHFRSSRQNRRQRRHDFKNSIKNLTEEINYQLRNNRFEPEKFQFNQLPDNLPKKFTLPPDILNKTFSALTNHELRLLSLSLR